MPDHRRRRRRRQDLEERIAEAGFNAHWVNSVQNASAILDIMTPDIVILDVVVRTRTCMPLARELRARGIPFVVHSGYAPGDDLGHFDGAPWVRKPVEMSAMIKALSLGLQQHPADAETSIRPWSDAGPRPAPGDVIGTGSPGRGLPVPLLHNVASTSVL